MKRLSAVFSVLAAPLFAAALAGPSCAASGNASRSEGSAGSSASGSGGTSAGSPFDGTSGSGSSGTSGSGFGGAGSGGSPFGGAGSAGTTVAAGTGGTTDAGTAGTAACSIPSTIATNGYGMSGTWKGYAYTFGGSTAMITPGCDSAGTMPCFKMAGANLCASGTLGADTTFASVAGVGWNINQEEAAPNPVATVAPTGTGIAVNVAGGTAGLRVSISDGTTEWCAPLPAGGSGTVPWASFNTKCWDSSGTAYTAGTPIAKVQILLPSMSAAALPFCICVVSIGPG